MPGVEWQSQLDQYIAASPETVWRHLTRVSDWPRWYPGIFGVDRADPVTAAGNAWHQSGQMGRFLYRGQTMVEDYQPLRRLLIHGERRPWLRCVKSEFILERSGTGVKLTLNVCSEPGLSLFGRYVLGRILRKQLATETIDTVARLRAYVERAMPHH